MMNLLALGLLLSALAAAGVLSPHPDTNPHHDPLLREGHRLIVVEYERQLPRDPSYHSAPPPTADHHHLIDEAKEKFQEAASLLPNLGQGISAPPPSHGGGIADKICDAYGTCRDKLSTLVGGKGKDELSDKASKFKDDVGEIKDDLSRTASQIKDDTVYTVVKGKDALSGKASQIKENAMDAVGKGKDKLSEKASLVKNKLSEKASEVKEGAKDAVKSVANGAREAGEEIAGNISSSAEKVVDVTEQAATDLRRNLTDIVRRARDVAFDAAAYVGAPETARAAAAVAHLMAVAVAYGAGVWVTFVSSHVLASALPRQQFGVVQSKLYPVYFRVLAYGVGVALVGQFFGRDRRSAAERVQGYNLTAALGLVLVNMLYVEPKATRVMFERMKMEKEEGRGRDMADVVLETPVSATTSGSAATTAAAFGVARTALDSEAVKSRVVKLNKRLKRLNTYSSFLNVMTMMGLTWHMVHLARCLQPSC